MQSIKKDILNIKPLLILILFCSYSYTVTAQSSVESFSEGVEYTNDSQILEEFKAEAKALISEGVQFTPEKAARELKKNMNKRIYIKSPSPNKTALKGSSIYQKAVRSTVLIGKPYSHGDHNHFATASGYIIDRSGIVVTNYHVVEVYANRIREAFAMLAHTNDGKTYLVKKILSASKEQDLAILQLETNGDKLTPIALGQPATVGSTIYVLSHPQEMVNFFSKGIVSRNVKNEDHHSNILEYEMSITADYGVGSSGGPILDRFGNLVGTVASTYNIYANPQQNKGLQIVVKSAIPVAALKMMILD